MLNFIGYTVGVRAHAVVAAQYDQDPMTVSDSILAASIGADPIAGDDIVIARDPDGMGWIAGDQIAFPTVIDAVTIHAHHIERRAPCDIQIPSKVLDNACVPAAFVPIVFPCRRVLLVAG